MNTCRRFSNIFPLSFLVIILFFSEITFAQAVIKGKVTYESDGVPAASVTIELLDDKGTKTLSDEKGNFYLKISNAQKKDSISISSVGYKRVIMPVSAALAKSEFTLSEVIKTIEGVTVFKSHETVGSISESVGYYRSWDYKKNTNGEIGRFFTLPYKKFKIDKIRFKAGNTCDTCLLRLHIRRLYYGVPGDEILNDSISVFVNNLSLDSKISEFDLTPYDYIFTENNFYVGIELLNCGNGKKGFCSFNFAGTEKGEYIYKSTGDSQWQKTDDYTIYLKLFLRF
jgi:hypothetical protein